MDFGLDTLVQDAWRQADRHFEAVRDYPYHHRGHSEEVFRRTMELCDAEDISDEVREEIAVAAIFHDTGYSRAYSHNEPIGAEFARDFLVRRWWGASRTDRVESLILATALGAEAITPAHAILQDADLDILGRGDGVASTFWLYEEMARFSDLEDSWIEWLEKSVFLFRTHEFRTRTARADRLESQRQNLMILESILEREHRVTTREKK